MTASSIATSTTTAVIAESIGTRLRSRGGEERAARDTVLLHLARQKVGQLRQQETKRRPVVHLKFPAALHHLGDGFGEEGGGNRSERSE